MMVDMRNNNEKRRRMRKTLQLPMTKMTTLACLLPATGETSNLSVDKQLVI